jgi:hypothetical protein
MIGEVLPQLFLVLAHLGPADRDRGPDPFAGRSGQLSGRAPDLYGQCIGLQPIGRLLEGAADAALDPQR